MYKKTERSNAEKPKSLTSETTPSNNIITDNLENLNPNVTEDNKKNQQTNKKKQYTKDKK